MQIHPNHPSPVRREGFFLGWGWDTWGWDSRISDLVIWRFFLSIPCLISRVSRAFGEAPTTTTIEASGFQNDTKRTTKGTMKIDWSHSWCTNFATMSLFTFWQVFLFCKRPHAVPQQKITYGTPTKRHPAGKFRPCCGLGSCNWSTRKFCRAEIGWIEGR